VAFLLADIDFQHFTEGLREGRKICEFSLQNASAYLTVEHASM
jgi:hypothetical protein